MQYIVFKPRARFPHCLFGLENIQFGKTHTFQHSRFKGCPWRSISAVPPIMLHYLRLFKHPGVVSENTPVPQTSFLNHNMHISYLTLSKCWHRLDFARLGFKRRTSLLKYVSLPTSSQQIRLFQGRIITASCTGRFFCAHFPH